MNKGRSSPQLTPTPTYQVPQVLQIFPKKSNLPLNLDIRSIQPASRAYIILNKEQKFHFNKTGSLSNDYLSQKNLRKKNNYSLSKKKSASNQLNNYIYRTLP